MTRTHSDPPAGPADDRPIRVRTENGHQLIELPDDIRLEGDTIYVSRDITNGNVVLSEQPRPRARSWAELFAILDEIGSVSDDFMADRPLNVPVSFRSVFDDLP